MKSAIIKLIILCVTIAIVYDLTLYFSMLYGIRAFFAIMPEESYFFYDLLQPLIYLLITVIAYLIGKRLFKFGFNTRGSVTLKSILAFILISILFRVFVDFVVNFDYILSRSEINLDISPVAINFKFWVNVITSVIVIPVSEEIVFRGLVFKLLRSRLGLIVATIISSLLFSVGHINPLNLHFSLPIQAFLFGMILAIVYSKYKLKGAILLHSAYNMLVLVLGLNKLCYLEILNAVNFDWRYWCVIILAGLGLFLLVKETIFAKTTMLTVKNKNSQADRF